MKKLIILFLLLMPFGAFAQNSGTGDLILKAKVVEIVEQKLNQFPDGTSAEQQNLRLEITEGSRKGEKVFFNGIGNFDVVKKVIYNLGDEVLIDASTDDTGHTNYYITDYVRTYGLEVLAIVFCIVLFLISGFKGVRAILSLMVSFFVIIKYIIPQIIAGTDPFIVTILGSFIILLAIVYITEGFCARAHITVLSILISLILTFIVSSYFSSLVKLSGLSNEESMFLITYSNGHINFVGLLLASIIIGALGVLDDVVISQVTAVEQIIKADPLQSRMQVFKGAYEVGISHISSMTNTLFLAYAGASLPLLILFISGQSAFSTWGQIINNEAIATEIVRTLAGSIGLVTAVPISTALAAWWFVRPNKKT